MKRCEHGISLYESCTFCIQGLPACHQPAAERPECMQKNIPGDKCPQCGSDEVEANTPSTVYACGSRDYDQRPGTFRQGENCKPAPSQQGDTDLRAEFEKVMCEQYGWEQPLERTEDGSYQDCRMQFTWIGYQLAKGGAR